MNAVPRGIGDIIKRLYAARNELRQAFPGLSFTLDGKLVGDIGEAIAMDAYRLIPLAAGAKRHDFRTEAGREVQVKLTQQTKGNVGLGRSKQRFEHLVVLQVFEDGTYSVLFDGPGEYIDRAWAHKKSASLSILQLRRLNDSVKETERLRKP